MLEPSNLSQTGVSPKTPVDTWNQGLYQTPYILYVFTYILIPMAKFNLYIKHYTVIKVI